MFPMFHLTRAEAEALLARSTRPAVLLRHGTRTREDPAGGCRGAVVSRSRADGTVDHYLCDVGPDGLVRMGSRAYADVDALVQAVGGVRLMPAPVAPMVARSVAKERAMAAFFAAERAREHADE